MAESNADGLRKSDNARLSASVVVVRNAIMITLGR